MLNGDLAEVCSRQEEMLRITTTILFSVVTLATAQSAGDFASKKADLEALERM